MVCGELGLTGEVRPVTRLDARLSEATKLGLTQFIGPEMKAATLPTDALPFCAVESLIDALPICFNGVKPS